MSDTCPCLLPGPNMGNSVVGHAFQQVAGRCHRVAVNPMMCTLMLGEGTYTHCKHGCDDIILLDMCSHWHTPCSMALLMAREEVLMEPLLKFCSC